VRKNNTQNSKKKKTSKERFSIEQKENKRLDDIGAQMETKPREYLRPFDLENEVQNPRTLSKYDIQ
jgi:hypothetical protein